MRQKRLVVMGGLAILLLYAGSAAMFAASRGGKGQGAIVIRDDAPVYTNPDRTEVEWKLKRGDAVAGITSGALTAGRFQFDEKNGRAHVQYFRGEEKGMARSGWMDPGDLSRFTYDGSCEDNASPFATKGFSMRWNACFQEGRDDKLDKLRLLWAQEDVAKAGKVPAMPPGLSQAQPAPAKVPK